MRNMKPTLIVEEKQDRTKGILVFFLVRKINPQGHPDKN